MPTTSPTDIALGTKIQPIQTLIELHRGQEAITRLSEEYFASGINATAIMCSEHDSDNCHRKTVAQRLYDDHNINTKHIGRTGGIVNHVNVSNRTPNVGAEPDVSQTQQVMAHKKCVAKTNSLLNYPTVSNKDIATGPEINKPKKGKSVLISVPQEGESYKVAQ